jgi:hypothetical protein
LPLILAVHGKKLCRRYSPVNNDRVAHLSLP